METLFSFSKLYFAARTALAGLLSSPFLQLVLVIAAFALLWRAGEGARPPEDRAAAPVSAARLNDPADAAGREALLAWAVLGQRSAGASGKALALSRLYRMGTEFPGLDLSCARLNACPDGAHLVGVDLSRTEERRAVLSGAKLARADFSNARLAGVDLSDSGLEAARFEGADLTGAVLRGARGPSAIFAGAALAGADLTEADLSRAELDAADLSGAELVRAQLGGATLEGARLNGAVFDGADLSNARLSGAALAGARFNLATLDGAEVSNADFAGARDLDTAFAEGLWAWADAPPRNLDAAAAPRLRVALCDPGADDAVRRAHRTAEAGGPGRPADC